MNRVKFTLLAAISIATALTISSCAGTPLQSALLGTGQPEPQKEERSPEIIRQERQQIAELEAACTKIRLEGIDCILGVGESSLEGPARDMSLFDAQSLYAQSLQTALERETERTVTAVNKNIQQVYKQTATGRAEQTVSRAFPYVTKTTFDGEYYKVYTLMVINPEDLKEIVEASAAATGDEEVIAKVKSPEVQDSFFKKISVFKDIVLPLIKTIAANIIR